MSPNRAPTTISSSLLSRAHVSITIYRGRVDEKVLLHCLLSSVRATELLNLHFDHNHGKKHQSGINHKLMAAHGFETFAHESDDLVLAAHFNKFGTRFITGSADHKLRVFELARDGSWVLFDTWRGHNGEVLDVKWNGEATGQVLASIGEDLKLKIWQEDPSEADNSGRRFKNIFTQSSAQSVIYTSLDFITIQHESFLAVVTRDGLLSLLEPVVPHRFDDWKELDQLWVCGGPTPRGVGISFKLCFQQSERPNYVAVQAGLDKAALSLAVTAMDSVKVYRVLKLGHDGDGPYRFQSPVSILTGAASIIRDIAWAPENHFRYDLISTASADGYVRVYEITTPKEKEGERLQPANPPSLTSLAVETSAPRTSSRAPSGIGAGLAGASLADSLAPLNIGQIRHEWRMSDEIKHEGVWRVEWIRGAGTLASSGDEGKVRLWKKAVNGSWMEFAEFGPSAVDETEDEPMILE